MSVRQTFLLISIYLYKKHTSQYDNQAQRTEAKQYLTDLHKGRSPYFNLISMTQAQNPVKLLRQWILCF